MTFGAFWGEPLHKTDQFTFTIHTVKESTTGQITPTWHLLEMTEQKKQNHINISGQLLKSSCSSWAKPLGGDVALLQSYIVPLCRLGYSLLVQQEQKREIKKRKRGSRGRRSKTRVAQWTKVWRIVFEVFKRSGTTRIWLISLFVGYFDVTWSCVERLTLAHAMMVFVVLY